MFIYLFILNRAVRRIKQRKAVEKMAERGKALVGKASIRVAVTHVNGK